MEGGGKREIFLPIATLSPPDRFLHYDGQR